MVDMCDTVSVKICAAATVQVHSCVFMCKYASVVSLLKTQHCHGNTWKMRLKRTEGALFTTWGFLLAGSDFLFFLYKILTHLTSHMSFIFFVIIFYSQGFFISIY